MIILRIIDTNSNNYFTEKIKDFSFGKIHYGGASKFECIFEENPLFKNHKIELFNNVYLYYHSNLIWSGYITEFKKDYNKLNYTLGASGLLIDLQNKRIKKTYVLDDIGDFKNWNEKNNKESDEILYGYSQPKDEKGVKISLLQRSYNAEEDGLFEIKIDENIERLKARIFINQPANFTTKLVTLDENHSNPNEEKKWENAQKIDEDVILDITKIASAEATGGTFTKKIYPSDDAEVYNRESGTNFGSSSQIRLKEYVYLHRGFIKFATSEIPPTATIISATLKVYKFHPYGAPNASGYRVASNWNEGTITWNNQPGITGSLICTYGGALPVGWKSMNILSTFKNWWNGAWANYGLRFKVNSASGILDRFYSKEASSAYRPYIEVKYSAPVSEGYDIEINKRYLQFRVECTANETISTDKYFAQLENLKLLTTDNEINAGNILKDLLLNHTQKLDLNTSLIQDCFNYKDIELCESLNGWNSGLNFSLENSIVKEGSHSIKTIVGTNKSYFFDFSSDDGNWTLSNATISGGVLDCGVGGNGRRSPDANWYSGVSDNFTVEVAWKMDSDTSAGLYLRLFLINDATEIVFDIRGAAFDLHRIHYGGVLKAQAAFNPVINTWYTARIRRVGTTYYYRAHTTLAEISWNYATARAINYIELNMQLTGGDYDNFKYSWVKELTKTLSPTQNLQNKNLFRLWVRSTITGDILKAKFGENERYQYEPDWSCQYEANQKPQDAEPIWVFNGTDYGSVSGGILTINKTGANVCYYTRTDIGHNVKGNTIVARMKCDNAAKTTYIILRDGIASVVIAIYATKIEDWNDAANVYTTDMTKYRELWLTMKNNFWVLYVDGVFALCGETQTTALKYFLFGMDGSANLGKSYWDYVYYYNLGFLRNKRIEKTIGFNNLNLNPSIEIDTSGYTLYSSTISKDTVEFYKDIASLKTITSNLVAGEGWYRDVLTETEAGKEYTFSVYLKGSGTVYLRFYDNVSGSQFGNAITLTPTWTRYNLTKTFGAGSVGRNLAVFTQTQQAITFYSDAIMHSEGSILCDYEEVNSWKEFILDLNNFPIATRNAIEYIQFEVLTNSAFTFYIDWIRSNFELTSAYYRDRTAPLNILEDALAYQDYEWTILKNGKVKFFEVDRDTVDYICPIKNLVFEEDSVSYFNKIYLIYFDAMMKRQEIELIDEDTKIPFDKEHIVGLGGLSDTGAKAIGEAQFDFHKKPRYQLSCSIEDFVFDKNGGIVKPIEIEPNKNIKFIGIADLPIFRVIKTSYANGICTLTLETEEETITNITKSIIEVL